MNAKRALDLALTVLTVPLWGPLLGFVAVVVRLTLGRPVLFRQTRAGKDGGTFELVKFRTMRDATDASGRSLPDAERLTAVGRFLRATSLDELPELVNVLRGDMSLVGPRPLLVDYLPLYSERQRRRHDVLPGITGWAQINGRNALGWEDRFELDVWYVEHRTFWLDVRVLGLTMVRVLARAGISHAGEATMHRFEGSTARHDG